MEEKVYPTGTCFEDVTLMFIQMLMEQRERFSRSSFLMVHGICLNADGNKYSHAWIEEGELVWFPAIIRGKKGFGKAKKKEFYRVYKVQCKTRYTAKEAQVTALKHGDAPPPWELKYLKLCKDYEWNEALKMIKKKGFVGSSV